MTKINVYFTQGISSYLKEYNVLSLEISFIECYMGNHWQFIVRTLHTLCEHRLELILYT